MDALTLSLASLLLVSLAIGAYSSRSIKDTRDYYSAAGRMPWYMLVGTFMASNVSAGLFLGATNASAQNGYAMWAAFFPTCIGYLLCIGFVAIWIRRLSDRYEIMDLSDLFYHRFRRQGKLIRSVSSIIIVFAYLPVLIAQFIALASIISVLLDVSYAGSLLAISLVVVSYTLLGGMLGVIRADGVQFIILLVGLLVAVPMALSAAGEGEVNVGWQRISRLPEIFEWTTPGLPWFAVLGQLVWLFAIPVQPHLVSRFLAARTERDIVISLPICVGLTLFIYTATIPLGLAGRILEPDLESGAYYYVVMAVNHFPVLVGALALAGIASAALSTCSTVLLIAGQTVSRQVLQRLPMPGWFTPMYGARAGVLIIGVATWLIAAIQPLGIFWLVVLSASLLASGFFVPLFLGMLWRRASAEGAVAAMLTGTLSAVTVYLVNGLFGTHLFISEVFAGLAMSLIIMVVISFKSPASEQEMAVLDYARKLPAAFESRPYPG